MRVPVLIAGGGPSGLALAVELGRAGIRCLVVEPRERVLPGRPRAKTTSVRTMELLRRWGLADRLRAAAPLPVSYAQDVVFCTGLLGREITRFRNAFGMHAERHPEFAESAQQIPQPAVEVLLREVLAELPTVELRTGHRLITAEDRPDGVRAQIEGPGGVQLVEADYLAGCDGAAGTVRKAIGAEYSGASGARPNLSITYRAPGLTDERLCARAVHYWVLGENGGLGGRMDLDGTWWAIAQGVADPDAVDPAALVRRMIGAEVDVQVQATDPWRARMLLADRFRAHRTFLVGDAAHQNPPWGGHGYNTSVGDAVNLGWKLAAVLRGWAGPALLDSYEPERRPVAERTIADAAAQEAHLAPSFASPSAEALQAKRGEFHSLGLVLGYHYAGSPVVVDDGSPVPEQELSRYHGSARPGARLPHRWLADGSALFDHLGPGFTLLRLDSAADPEPFRAAAAERGVPLAVLDPHGLGDPESYGAPLLLVRPDQHVAWRGEYADARRVLDTALGRG